MQNNFAKKSPNSTGWNKTYDFKTRLASKPKLGEWLCFCNEALSMTVSETV